MRKKYIVEIGMGADLHGQDVTKAGRKAVKDAISHSCLCGLQEILGLREFDDIYVDVKLATPLPEEIDQAAILAEIPFGRKTLQVVEGGITVPAIYVEQFGDKNKDIVAVLAAVTLSVDIDEQI